MWLKLVFNDRKIIFLVGLTLLIRLLSTNEAWVERYFTYGVYPFISRGLRLFFGWVPFPVGDIIYFFAGLYLLFQVIKLVHHIKRKTFFKLKWWQIARRALIILLTVYLLFNLLWGLNYDRQGIAHQMQLQVESYSQEDVQKLTTVLQQRLNTYATQVTPLHRASLEDNRNVYKLSIDSYKQASQKHPFLQYNIPSIKGSLYTYVGHYFGFTGYYNPFTGEAQLKTTIPSFLKPFVVNHEIGHQVGFGKENEANFVAYLAGKESPHLIVRYSTYFEAYLYAVRDLRRRDSVLATQFMENLHPQVKTDIEELILYYKKNENKLEPYIARFYDQYLKLNRQPKGTRTYNEVVAWLVAFQKKYGIQAI